MMASLAMAVYRGLPVNLPQAVTGQNAPSESAAVTVTRDGGTYLDRERIAAEGLGDRLRARVATAPDLAVVINADADVPHGRVVDVLDQARAAGVARLAIAIVPRQQAAAQGLAVRAGAPRRRAVKVWVTMPVRFSLVRP